MEETKVKKRTGKLKRERENPKEENADLSKDSSSKNERKKASPPKKKPAKKKKKRKAQESIHIARVVRSSFLILVGLFIVYGYYLQTEGVLIEGIVNIWREYKPMLLSVASFIIYSVLLFYMGVRRGRKK